MITVLATLTFQAQAKITNVHKFLEEVYADIREEVDVAVIGMSGGADSTLVTILCANALGTDNVIGVHMPAKKTDKSFFNSRSQKTAKALKIRSINLPIENTIATFKKDLQKAVKKLTIVNKGNISSRIRMATLYAISHAESENGKRVRVIGTGNLSEDYIGYNTKGGEAVADYFPIGQLFKSEVYQLLDYFKKKQQITESMIDRVPSAGLWEGQTDKEELGFSYDAMEPAIRKALNNQQDTSVIGKFVRKRHITHAHKHQAPVVFDARVSAYIN